MTRECLIFGGMRDICLTDSFGNENLILQIREELKEKMPGENSFDILVADDGYVYLDFLYDKRDSIHCDEPVIADITRLLTGEGIDDFKLVYPLIDNDKKGSTIFKLNGLISIYQKNNKAYGGDDVEIEDIHITSSHMLVIMKFKL